MPENIILCRILISVAIIALIVGYLLKLEIIIYLFAIGILLGHAFKIMLNRAGTSGFVGNRFLLFRESLKFVCKLWRAKCELFISQTPQGIAVF